MPRVELQQEGLGGTVGLRLWVASSGDVEVAELAVDGNRPAVGGDGFAVVAQHGGGAAEVGLAPGDSILAVDGASVVAGFSRTYYRWMHDPRVANAGFFIVLVAMFSGVGGVMGRWADRIGADLALSIARLIA